MTNPASSDARDQIARPAPKLPHERDESTDREFSQDAPEIEQAAKASSSTGQSDTSKGGEADAAYNDRVVPPGGRESGTSSGRTEPDPAAKK